MVGRIGGWVDGGIDECHAALTCSPPPTLTTCPLVLSGQSSEYPWVKYEHFGVAREASLSAQSRPFHSHLAPFPTPSRRPTARASSSPFLGSRCSCLYRPRCQGRSHDFPPEAFPSSIGLRNRSFVPIRVMTLFLSHRRHAFLHPRITSLTARRAELAFITHPPGLP